MQINEYKTGWLRKRYIVACTIMAADPQELAAKLPAAIEEISQALDYHPQQCSKVLFVVAAGQKSTREHRPAMREMLETSPGLRAIARRVKIRASFLNRMGDNEGKFRIRKG